MRIAGEEEASRLCAAASCLGRCAEPATFLASKEWMKSIQAGTLAVGPSDQ